MSSGLVFGVLANAAPRIPGFLLLSSTTLLLLAVDDNFIGITDASVMFSLVAVVQYGVTGAEVNKLITEGVVTWRGSGVVPGGREDVIRVVNMLPVPATVGFGVVTVITVVSCEVLLVVDMPVVTGDGGKWLMPSPVVVAVDINGC